MRNKAIMTMIMVLQLTVGLLDVRAATFCATNSAELQSSLDMAAVNGEDDYIRIATGTYQSPSGGFIYNSAGLPGGDEKSLSISGGWTEFFGNPCGQQLSKNPSLTAISGNGSNRGLAMYLRQSGSVSITLLTFVNGYASGSIVGGGLSILTINPYNGSISIENNHFIANEADSAGAMYIYFDHGPDAQLEITNNLIVGNHARSLVGAVSAVVNSTEFVNAKRGIIAAPTAISFTNNTVVNNSTDNTTEFAVGGIFINGSVAFKWVVNNNLWNNDGADIRVLSPAGYRLWNNNFQTRIGLEPEFVENNISVEPEYKSCGIFCVHREPVVDSPLVDAGTHPIFTFPWSLTATDSAGRTRVTGPVVDIGAYENQSRLFVDRFEQ